MKNIFWIKYCSKWNSGSSEWEYRFFYKSERTSNEDQVADFILEERAKHDWSGSFRGMEYEMLDVVPENVLSNFIKGAHSEIEYAQQKLAILEAFKANQS